MKFVYTDKIRPTRTEHIKDYLPCAFTVMKSIYLDGRIIADDNILEGL